MTMTSVFVLLLQRAEDPEHADRAWSRMASWTPATRPSVLDDQVDEALRLTRTGAEMELCRYDDVHLERMAQEKAAAESLEDFKRRYKL